MAVTEVGFCDACDDDTPSTECRDCGDSICAVCRHCDCGDWAPEEGPRP